GGQECGIRRHEKARLWSGCRLAEVADEGTPTLPRLGARHHLLEDAAHGSLEDRPASRDPEPRMEPPEVPDQWVLGPEVGVVVVPTEGRRRPSGEPLGARPPGLYVQRVPTIDGQPLRPRPERRPGRAPGGVRGEPDGRVGGAAPKRPQRQA